MEGHALYLQEVCCAGGKNFTECSQTTRYRVEKYKKELKSVHNIAGSHTHTTCPSYEADTQAPSFKYPGEVLARMISNYSIRCDFH